MSNKFLEQLVQQHKNSGNDEVSFLYEQILQLKNQKLYHQLTEKLLVLVKRPELQNGDELIKLYNNVLKDLETRLKPLSMARVIVQVSSQYKSANEAIEFLDKKSAHFQKSHESFALLRTACAHIHGAEKNFEKAKEILEEVQGVIDSNLGIDPTVFSQYYRVLAMHHKNQVHAGEFYKAGLLYLAYTTLDSIEEDVKSGLARDLALAGLVAEDVYGLGELLSHPIADSLKNDKEQSWLLDMVNAFNSGKIDVWNELKEKNKQQVKQNQTLDQNLGRLEEKIVILALIELIWSKPADGRSLPFSEIAKATHLPSNKVELLVMKAFCLGLVKGEIDQVRQIVIVSAVQPRVLSFDQIAEMQLRVKGWAKHVESTLMDVEGNTTELFSN